MKSYRRTAILIGVLYILGTVAGILSVLFTNTITNDPDFMLAVSANQSQVIVGTLFILTMGISLALIPALLYPIAKVFNEVLAVGYVVFRGRLKQSPTWRWLSAGSWLYHYPGDLLKAPAMLLFKAWAVYCSRSMMRSTSY
jgi:hypothetical protein